MRLSEAIPIIQRSAARRAGRAAVGGNHLQDHPEDWPAAAHLALPRMRALLVSIGTEDPVIPPQMEECLRLMERDTGGCGLPGGSESGMEGQKENG